MQMNEERLHAYVDDALAAAERREVEAYLAAHPEEAVRVDAYRAQNRALHRLFDPVLGRIQIPTQGALTDREWLTRVLRHEFVHALLHHQQGANSGSIPTWLNEGLAMQLSGDSWRELDRALEKDVELVPLTALEGSWEQLSPQAAMVAYVEASSATHYLLDRFGMHKMHEVLGHLKARQPLAMAMQDKLLLSYDSFQQQWAQAFHSKQQHTQS